MILKNMFKRQMNKIISFLSQIIDQFMEDYVGIILIVHLE